MKDNIAQLTSVQQDFHGKAVRIMMINKAPYFVLKDICAILGISKHRDAARSLDDDEKKLVIVDTFGGPQGMVCVTESGLYRLACMSRKPIAKASRRWVTSEVLPGLRKGRYAMGDIPAAGYTARMYLDARGIKEIRPAWLSLQCRKICNRRGTSCEKRWFGTVYPGFILDEAVKGRDGDALRGPAVPVRPSVLNFFTDTAINLGK